jgi:ferredoxin-type protein NapH
MAKKQGKRQRVRKALLLISLLSFPVIINYLSPYVIIDGAMNGVVNGSMIMFAGMFASSLLVGRLWCGWLCPGAGLEEACIAVNDRPFPGGRWNWIKWAIWVPWLGVIAFSAASAGGYTRVDFFHLTESGISVDRPQAYVIYYSVIGIFAALAWIAGKRAACHTICWMAPFMILGRKIRNLFAWPALRLKAEQERCIDCKRCTKVCPMSLDVNRMVQSGAMENSECILCGSCVDTCPKDVIHYSFNAGK